MDHQRQPPGSRKGREGHYERHVVDRLADSFVLERSESEWLLTLLSAKEIRYIFEGSINGEDPD